MADYITDIAVSTFKSEEKDLQAQGYTRLKSDLTEGAPETWYGFWGEDIFLWYKRGGGSKPITKLQLTFSSDIMIKRNLTDKDHMAGGLTAAGYTWIDKDLNGGAGGNYIYLWYKTGSGEYDTPIEEIDVTTSYDQDAQKFADGWERLGCNVNRDTTGSWIFVWVKRAQQTYICDVIATSTYEADDHFFQDGYIRVDENLNRKAGGKDIFLWYRQTTDPKRALTDLKVSITGEEYESYKNHGYECVGQNLNEGTGSNQAVNLWYKRHKPIKGILLLLQIEAVPAYLKAGITVIEKDLNNQGKQEYICFNQ